MESKQAISHKEKQYNSCIDLKSKQGLSQLGLMTNWAWHDDPKRLTWLLSRYKFVGKMLSGYDSALEIGCADAFASRIVRQEVSELTVIDFDPLFIRDIDDRMDLKWGISPIEHDILEGPLKNKQFEAAFSMDVIEHISKEKEHLFIENIRASLSKNGVLIIGTPSIESQEYASLHSKVGHVNCKSAPEWKKFLQNYFHHVFNFSMNDEVVHTGFHKMAQYLIMLCTNRTDI
jgi:cyclopropane fatty-acyl-phospholipid synthase-like methyltransferase